MPPIAALSNDLLNYNFVALSKSAQHPREKMRYLAFSHLKEGKTPRQVADILRVSCNTIYRWLREFKLHGLSGLSEKPGRGKKLLIPISERDAFRQAVIDLQNNRSGGCIRGKDVLLLMKQKYGITCSVKSVYNHLKMASLVWITARSRHPKADFEQQEEFKKNFEKKS
jgi:transposase